MKSTKASLRHLLLRGRPPHREGADHRHSNVRRKFPGCGGSPAPQACVQRLDAIGRSLVPENFTS